MTPTEMLQDMKADNPALDCLVGDFAAEVVDSS